MGAKMIQLRPYQAEAVRSVYQYLENHDDNPCVVTPTASGKSIMIAQIATDAVCRKLGLDKRCDAVVFGQDGAPLMIVECKAAAVAISQKTLDQAVRYYSALHPKFLMLYNGEQCYCFKASSGSLKAMDHLPVYQEMLG